MGTRSLIIVQEKQEDGSIIVYCVLYHQYDGYLNYIGVNLFKFLKKVEYRETGDLAAHIIMYFKRKANKMCKKIGEPQKGYCYLYPTTQTNGFDIEFRYILTVSEKIEVTIDNHGTEKFFGNVKDALKYCKQPEYE